MDLYPPKNTADLKNIEKLEERMNQKQIPILDHLSFSGKYWNIESIEFMDVTDRNNTLIESVKGLSYRPNTSRRNLLFAHNSENDKGFFILKGPPAQVSS